MNNVQKLEFLLENYKNGTYTTVVTKKKVKTLAAYRHLDIQKKSTYTKARMGINYDNLGNTKERRLNGEAPKENQGLSRNLEWYKFPTILRNKEKETLLVRLYVKIEDIETPEYTIDGTPATKSEVLQYLGKQSSSTPPEMLTLNVNFDSICELC